MRRTRSGFSLVETMVATALVGVIIVAVVSAFSSATLATNRHRLDTTLDRVVRSDAEFIKSQAYRPKPPPPGVYANLAVPGYVFAVQVLYFSPLGGGSFTVANPDVGLQEIVLTVNAPGGATETLRFLKVRP
jgi:prepilin-type N-terminal cleavage/methylation domain-containing protein